MPISLTHKEIDQIRKQEIPHPERITVYRRYAKGDHDRMETDDQRRAFGRTGHKLADNVLKLIAVKAASRLRLTGWDVSPTPATNPQQDPSEESIDRARAVSNYLQGLWMRNQMSRKQYDTHFAQLRDGNHAITLRWKPGDGNVSRAGRVTIHRERWWDGESGIFVATDDADEPIWAVKDWQELIGGRQRDRRVIYYEDRFERYIKEGRGWVAYSLPTDPPNQIAPGVMPWQRADGRPLGLPVVYFPNGTEDDSPYGQSDFAGLVPLQDDLNSIQLDIAAASAFTGYQMYWISGAQSEQPTYIGPGMLLQLSDVAARAGAIPAGDLSSLISGHEYKRSAMAVDSETPIHEISGDWPSGDALVRADMPAVDKATRLAEVNGPQWTMVAHRATEIQNAYGGSNLDENAPIMSVFADPQRLDALTIGQISQAKIGVYTALSMVTDPVLFRKAAIESGALTKDEVEEILADRDAERARMDAQFEQTTPDDDETEPPDGQFGA